MVKALVATKEEFMKALREICDKSDSWPRPTKELKRLVSPRNMAWTHCHHCGRSNERFDCNFDEEFRELNHKCHAESWKCRHCGEGQLKIYCGCQGEEFKLPTYDEVLAKVQKFMEFYWLEGK